MATAETQVTKPSTLPAVRSTPHPFAKLCANHVKVVIQQKGGNIIKGTAKWFRSNYLKLTEAEVIGKENRVTVPWILVENNSIGHLHSDAREPEKVDTPAE